jgi:hypothetical protein
VLGATTGAGAQLVSNAAGGRPLQENLGAAAVQGAGTSLVSSIAMHPALPPEGAGATPPDPAYAQALQSRIDEAVAAYKAGDYRRVQQLLTDEEFARSIGLSLDVGGIIMKEDPHTLTEQQLDDLARATGRSSWSGTSGPYISPRKLTLCTCPVGWNDQSEPVDGASVPALGKRLTPFMLEEWIHQAQKASGRPVSKLTSQYLAEHRLRWGPEHYEMDVIAAFYEWGFPVGEIGTARIYPERQAFADWYRSRPHYAGQTGASGNQTSGTGGET